MAAVVDYEKPSGCKQKSTSTARSACTRGSPKRKADPPLAVDLDRLLQRLKALGPNVAVVTEFLHLQHPPVGSEANLAQPGQIVQPPTHAQIVGVLMVVSVRSARPLCDIA